MYSSVFSPILIIYFSRYEHCLRKTWIVSHPAGPLQNSVCAVVAIMSFTLRNSSEQVRCTYSLQYSVQNSLLIDRVAERTTDC